MRKRGLLHLVLCVIVVSLWTVPAFAVSFGSYGADGSRNEPATSGGTALQHSPVQATPGTSPGKVLDLPAYERERLADSIRLTHLTGLQAKLALEELTALEGQSVSAAEIKARLVYAEESLEALEKAAKRLGDSVDIVRLAYEGCAGRSERLAFLLDFFCATPASAYGSFSGSPEVDGIIVNEMQKVGRGMKQTFDGMMNSLSSAAKTIGNYASKVKNAVAAGVGKVTGAVAGVHHRIGTVVGQKNWATIMAGTKFVAAITVAGVGLVVAAPVTTAGAVGAVVIYTAANVGACVSFASDMSQISGSGNASAAHLDTTLTRVNQATAVIGLATSGSGGEVVVNVIGVSGNEIIGTTRISHMTPEELAGYLDAEDREEFLQHFGAHTTYQTPGPDRGNEGGGGEGGGGGGDCGCH